MAPHEDNPWAKEYEENASRRGKSDVENMAWKTGDHSIRIMPAKNKGEMPFIKYIVHWIPVTTSKKDRPIIHAVDTKCPVCRFVGTLWSEVYRLKEEEDMTDEAPQVKKLLKQISKLRGKKTYDMNIIDRGDYRKEDKTIKVKRMVSGPTIWKPVIELGNSEKWGNPSAAGDRGYDLTVTVDGEGIKREYTILPDPDRKALTAEEVAAIDKCYDLKKHRSFSTPKDILDILESAKSPLDTIDLKKVRASLMDVDGTAKDEPVVDKKAAVAAVVGADDEDKDITPPADDEETPDVADDDDKEEQQQEKKVSQKESEKETTAFSKQAASEEVESEESTEDSEDAKLEEMDCRGTYDPEDMGCKECSIVEGCKNLKKTFKIKAAELEVDIDDMSGVEIEQLLKKKEQEAVKKSEKPAGKTGKTGTGTTTSTGRKLPF